MCNLYNRIDSLCKKDGITVSVLCRNISLSRSSLTELKSGRSKGISARNAQKIADYFGVTVDYLMTGEEKSSPTVVLTEGEQELLDLFRLVPVEDQQMVLGMIRLALNKRG